VPKTIAFPLVQKKSLMGAGKIEKGEEADLTSQISGKPLRLLVPQTADSLLVADETGLVSYFYLNEGKFEKRQQFKPFADAASPVIASMDFVFGDVSLVFTNAKGDCACSAFSFRGIEHARLRRDQALRIAAAGRIILLREPAQQVLPHRRR